MKNYLDPTLLPAPPSPLREHEALKNYLDPPPPARPLPTTHHREHEARKEEMRAVGEDLEALVRENQVGRGGGARGGEEGRLLLDSCCNTRPTSDP